MGAREPFAFTFACKTELTDWNSTALDRPTGVTAKWIFEFQFGSLQWWQFASQLFSAFFFLRNFSILQPETIEYSIFDSKFSKFHQIFQMKIQRTTLNILSLFFYLLKTKQTTFYYVIIKLIQSYIITSLNVIRKRARHLRVAHRNLIFHRELITQFATDHENSVAESITRDYSK